MPHRPERPAGAAAAMSSAVYSPHMATANALGGNVAGLMMHSSPQSSMQHSSMYNAAGVVTPVVNSMARQQQWMAGSTGIHRLMPTLATPKSSDSADRSTATKHDEDTVATLKTEGSTDDDMDKREATASALLLVSSKGVQHDSAPSSATAKADTAETSSVPLKKRKKHLDFLRRNQDSESTSDENPLYHVSPVSHSSLGSNLVEGRTVSSEEHTPKRPGHGGAHRSGSYDSKESPYHQPAKESTQELPDSAKIHNTTDIAPPSHVMAPHFPSILHRVLSESNFAGTVLTWLPDGESWKVLRWDALRREVLPLYFADLRDEDGKGSGTIDAFLWHLTAWGFEEIQEGSNVGAYRHDLFIRGAQKLCSKMRFTAVPADDNKGPKTVSPGRGRTEGDRSILQVPSLASVSRGDDSKPNTPNKRARYDEATGAGGMPSSSMHRTSPVPHPGATWPARPMEPSMMANYRQEDSPYSDTSAWGQYYTDSPHQTPLRHPGQYSYGGYDSRYPFRAQSAESVMRQPSAQYSPPAGVRSGRGAMRLPAAHRGESPGTTPVVRSSFPVSNRGKGSRRPSAIRAAVPAADIAALSAAASAADRTSPVERKSPVDRKSPVERKSPVDSLVTTGEETGKSVFRVAVAVSRKTKRKLPLVRNAGTEKAPSSST